MAETESKTNKAKAVNYFTDSLPNLDITQTTNYRVALLIKDKLNETNTLPVFLVSSVLSSVPVNVKPKIFREERELVDQCIDGFCRFINHLYINCKRDFDTEVFRSMLKNLSFVLDW